jgi:hypothetical protein
MITSKKPASKKKRKQPFAKEEEKTQTRRRCPKDRLRSRFYEPLVLLHVTEAGN